MEMSGGSTKVSGRTMMIPMEMVIPGIMPTINPNSDPMAVDSRVDSWLAWEKPSMMSGFMG